LAHQKNKEQTVARELIEMAIETVEDLYVIGDKGRFANMGSFS
jgi:predicted DNA-binding protein